MNATEIIDTLFEKTALNKARALYEAEKLTLPDVKRLFRQDVESAPVNLVHARINAKANRLAGNAAPKKQMSLSRYLRYERPDTLPKPKQMLDSGRITRRAGRNNSRVLATAHKEGRLVGDAIDVKGKPVVRHGDANNPGGIEFQLAWHPETKLPKPNTKTYRVNGINIGDAGLDSNSGGIYAGQFEKNIQDLLSPMEKKELRGLTARHELSGELHDMMRAYRGVERDNLPVAGSFSILPDRLNVSSHMTPNVLQGDYNMVRKMSYGAHLAENNIREKYPSGLTEKFFGRPLTESQARNILSGRKHTDSYAKAFTPKEKALALRNVEKRRTDNNDSSYADAFLATKPILNTEF